MVSSKLFFIFPVQHEEIGLQSICEFHVFFSVYISEADEKVSMISMQAILALCRI